MSHKLISHLKLIEDNGCRNLLTTTYVLLTEDVFFYFKTSVRYFRQVSRTSIDNVQN